MAAWQIEIFFVPGERYRGWSTLASWQSSRIEEQGVKRTFCCKEIERLIPLWLPIAESWSVDVRMWGKEDGDRVELVVADNVGVELTARVDLRNFRIEFVDFLLNLAEELDCDLSGTDGAICPTRSAFMHLISNSPQFRYIENPESFLDSLCQNSNPE